MINSCFANCTDPNIKGANILQNIEDTSILNSFIQAELKSPSPRKFIDGKTVHLSRRFDIPRAFGDAVLSDIGSAVKSVERRIHNVQPDIYRSPEVVVQAEWSYPIDIWNVGSMVSGRHLVPERMSI